MDRRTTLKWVLMAGAAWPLLSERAPGAAPPGGPGYGTDPDLTKIHRPGDFWPLTLTHGERRLTGILADLIIPADEHSPSASAVGVVEFIDEWVSAPYPRCQRDRPIVIAGLRWLDEEAVRRGGQSFARLAAAGQLAICDDICSETRAVPERRTAAQFFARLRDLTAGGFYCTPAGRKDLGYIGNVAQASFAGPPAALLKKLNLP
jgi:gluconate 2-dehydrogenase subunit 3-like protein